MLPAGPPLVILGAMADDTLLSATEVVEGRPFTDPEHTERETIALRGLLERERELLALAQGLFDPRLLAVEDPAQHLGLARRAFGQQRTRARLLLLGRALDVRPQRREVTRRARGQTLADDRRDLVEVRRLAQRILEALQRLAIGLADERLQVGLALALEPRRHDRDHLVVQARRAAAEQ
jgi:hypothetical protein